MEMRDGHKVKQDSVTPDPDTKGAGTVPSPKLLCCPQLQKSFLKVRLGSH